MKYMHQAVGSVRVRARRAAAAVRKWWRAHRDRITAESGYAEALAAVVLAAAQMATDSYRVRYLTHELVGAYVSVLRALSPSYRWRAD